MSCLIRGSISACTQRCSRTGPVSLADERSFADIDELRPVCRQAPTPLLLTPCLSPTRRFFTLGHIVAPGQTISSSSLTRRPGGKGANQACSVARSSAGQVTRPSSPLHRARSSRLTRFDALLLFVSLLVVGAIGEDGTWVKDRLQGYGVDVERIVVSQNEVTGRAIIQLSTADGENSISPSYSSVSPSFASITIHPGSLCFLLSVSDCSLASRRQPPQARDPARPARRNGIPPPPERDSSPPDDALPLARHCRQSLRRLQPISDALARRDPRVRVGAARLARCQ